MPEPWDVVVVGAGPAGASAARVAASAGARVLLLDRATFPRYKTCGGGLTGAALKALPPGVDYTLEQQVMTIQFSHRMRAPITRSSAKPLLAMVQRETFDQQNVDAAIAAGAHFQPGTTVQSVAETPHGVELRTPEGTIEASVVVGADGTGGRIGRYVGVRVHTTDLGLEVELPTPADFPHPDHVRLDWGADPGSYAWVFPKGNALSIGVIQQRGHPDATRDYLQRWLRHLGLDGVERQHDSGHLTQWRQPGSPVRRGRVLIAGETAGLLEPWTREGISFALRSGTWAGDAAAAATVRRDPDALEEYERRITADIEPEIAAGHRFLQLFHRSPAIVQLAVARLRRGSAYFFRYCRGEVTLRQTLSRHKTVGLLVADHEGARKRRRQVQPVRAAH